MKCEHVNQIKIRSTDKKVCDECVKAGLKWVKLRMCMVCGNVGCCDSSEGLHATKHFQKTKHAVMQSAEKGESWKWCYVDKDYVD